MATKDWPSWRYGPSGEAQIFQREADVPKGWVDSPSKLPPASEKLGDGDDSTRKSALLAENDALRVEVERIPDLRKELDRLREENDRLEAENESLRTDHTALVEAYEARQRELETEIVQLRKQISAAAETEQPTARRPRKLSTGAPGTPFTSADETVTLDEGRTERLKVLRDAGIEISDDATDGDIEEALDWLEKNPPKKKG